jgi:hypothetical protein
LLKAILNIEVRLRTRVADGHGQARLEAPTLEDVRTGQREQVPAAAVLACRLASDESRLPQ